MNAHTLRLAGIGLVVSALFPSAVAVRSAYADDDGEVPSEQTDIEPPLVHQAPTPSARDREERVQRRASILKAISTSDSVLINVTHRDLPASPDILNLGRRSSKALVRCATDNVDSEVREFCVSLLGRIGDRSSLLALQGALEAWEPLLRGAAIRALAKIPDPSSAKLLIQILEREDEALSNREGALETLGVLNNAQAIKTLRNALRSPPQGHTELRAPAFRGLWKSRHVVARAALLSDVEYALSATNDGSLLLQGTFAASELRAPELVKALIKLMDNPDTRIRNRAVYALGKIGDKAATKALLAHAPRVRESRMLNNIAFALERLDPAAFYSTAQGLASHKQAQIRMNTAFVLGDVHRPEGVPMLRSALEDPNLMVRLSAIIALGKVDAKDIDKLLLRFTKDTNFDLKREAIYSIFRASKMKATDLVYNELYSSKDPNVRMGAVRALGRAGDTRVTSDVLTRLEAGKCSLLDAWDLLRASKSSEVPERTLLAWVWGRTDLTDLLRVLKPAGAAPIARAEIRAEIAFNHPWRAVHAIDLAGDLGDAAAVEILRPILTNDHTVLRLHAAAALVRENKLDALPTLLQDIDNLPQSNLGSVVEILARVSESGARAALLPELTKRAASSDVPLAVVGAATWYAWDPEAAFHRMLAGLASPSRQERDGIARYLRIDHRPITTDLLRRALAREGRMSVKDTLRRLLDVRADRLAAKNR